ncbi:hypothetical protein [Massilia sp. TWR1-2-2]
MHFSHMNNGHSSKASKIAVVAVFHAIFAPTAASGRIIPSMPYAKTNRAR